MDFVRKHAVEFGKDGIHVQSKMAGCHIDPVRHCYGLWGGQYLSLIASIFGRDIVKEYEAFRNGST